MNKIKKNLKVVILAGGYGTRLSEYTKKIPKPMVQINRKPLLVHIINHYKKFGFKEFIIAAGYKKEVIKNYFKNKNVKVINTGLKTMTGGRIKRLQSHLKDQTFLLTYGDGLSDVNINNLLNFHKKSKNLVTLTAVRPPARFGAIKLKEGKANYFKEKSSLDEGWINGGFFIFEPAIFKYIKGDSTYLEREPLQTLSKKKLLGGYKHNGFWQCVDTERDKIILEKSIKQKKYKF
jgi:glucose-1-phosphate cytidylyltransferase|tara:strand:- start:5295 stop:5996 length:702 start_codon:yes stop_codon:yes gene_type:complete